MAPTTQMLSGSTKPRVQESAQAGFGSVAVADFSEEANPRRSRKIGAKGIKDGGGERQRSGRQRCTGRRCGS